VIQRDTSEQKLITPEMSFKKGEFYGRGRIVAREKSWENLSQIMHLDAPG
jgi:hypothetical protein